MKTNYTIEWAPFELLENTTEKELLEASEEMQTGFLDHQKGFIRRELLHLKNRHWVDLVYWENEELAFQAMENSQNSPICLKYFHLMVPPKESEEPMVLHLNQKRVYGGDKG